MTGLGPILDNNTRMLILGTFPGEASLRLQQYYAHPRNHFWPLLSAILGEELTDLAYPERLPRLLAHRMGLWDVLSACERQGSLDSAIQNAEPTDFSMLRQSCPSLEPVCFNGKTAGKREPQFKQAGFDTRVLPSSSPANARCPFQRKLAEWRQMLTAS
jgi:TDG/mug DNA glycosylase family protein